MLRGRCRSCGERISPEYPVVELLTALLFVGAALVMPSAWEAGFVAPFLAVLVACSFIDLHDRIIPNRIVYPSWVFFAAAALVLDLRAGRSRSSTASSGSPPTVGRCSSWRPPRAEWGSGT